MAKVVQKYISLRPYQKEFEENTESFNLSGFIRDKLDEEVIPNEQIPPEHRPEPVSPVLIRRELEAFEIDCSTNTDTENDD